jgi:hypothetical protein
MKHARKRVSLFTTISSNNVTNSTLEVKMQIKDMLFATLAFCGLAIACSDIEHIDNEPIYGVHLLEKSIEIQVMSNGCTDQHSFALEVAQQRLTIKRIKMDNCRRKAHKIWLTFDRPKSSEPFSIANPFVQ